MKFNVVFKLGSHVVAEVKGNREMVDPAITFREVGLEDFGAQVIQAEQTLERLTGLRVHIVED
jgi:hypothetical protein